MEQKKVAAPVGDTFIHLLKDLLSCAALHRIKRTVFGIGMSRLALFLRFLHSAVGRSTQDMLRSLRWDEQSLFNLMFVRMSIISFSMKTWGVVQGIAAAGNLVENIATSESLNCDVKTHLNEIQNFLLNIFRCIDRISSHRKYLKSTFNILCLCSHNSAFIAQFDFEWEMDFPSYNFHRLPRLGTWHLRPSGWKNFFFKPRKQEKCWHGRWKRKVEGLSWMRCSHQ